MEQALMELGLTGSLLAGLGAGLLLGAITVALMLRRQARPSEEELAKLRRNLRSQQNKLEQLRKTNEALEVEVTEWRRRNATRQAARTAGNSRYVSSSPAPEPDAWVIGALLEGDSRDSRGGKTSGFADTQIMPAA